MKALWGLYVWGDRTDCPTHGNKLVVERNYISTGTRYVDGSADERFSETLECGCKLDCWAYANDPDIRRYLV